MRLQVTTLIIVEEYYQLRTGLIHQSTLEFGSSFLRVLVQNNWN
jgi:hypothetical protein